LLASFWQRLASITNLWHLVQIGWIFNKILVLKWRYLQLEQTCSVPFWEFFTFPHPL
jgi:hypothetical protein